MASPTADVLIVGGGLAGSLLALELRRRGARVTLIEAEPGPGAPSATAWSYGVVPGWPLAPTPLARAAAGASRRWRALQRRHGDLGWRPARAGLLGGGALPALLAQLGVLPLAQVDAPTLLRRLPAVLAAAGVHCCEGEAVRLEPNPGPDGPADGPRPEGSAAWRVRLADGAVLEAGQLVLAAGASCRNLWPALPPALQRSWAGVLEVASPLLRPRTGRPALLLPGRFQRIGLERRSGALREPAWVVDAGLVPRQADVLVGQLSWIAGAGAAADAASGPPAAVAEGWLRQALAADAALTRAAPDLVVALERGQGLYRQLPVAFCRDGLPLAGPLMSAPPGLWLFSGFSGGFAQVPVLAPLLAAVIMAARERAPAAWPGGDSLARRELQRLQVWPGEPAVVSS